MSTTLATVLPELDRHAEIDRHEPPVRHLEVAATRDQRRARPKLVYAVVTLAGIGVILLAQLLMSIVVADGAYQIAGLQAEQRDLERLQEDLHEQLEVRNSVQNLTAHAEALGMVQSENPVFLDLESGRVTGTPTPAGDRSVGGEHLVGNSLLDGSTVVGGAPAGGERSSDASGDTGASAAADEPATVSSTPESIPSPTTH